MSRVRANFVDLFVHSLGASSAVKSEILGKFRHQTAPNMAETPDKRKLNELRVVDLKHELEKRGKDGNGVKNVLLERLTQVCATPCWMTGVFLSAKGGSVRMI